MLTWNLPSYLSAYLPVSHEGLTLWSALKGLTSQCGENVVIYSKVSDFAFTNKLKPPHSMSR